MRDEQVVVEEKALAMVDDFATEVYLRRFGGRLFHIWAVLDSWVYLVCTRRSLPLLLIHSIHYAAPQKALLEFRSLAQPRRIVTGGATVGYTASRGLSRRHSASTVDRTCAFHEHLRPRQIGRAHV